MIKIAITSFIFLFTINSYAASFHENLVKFSSDCDKGMTSSCMKYTDLLEDSGNLEESINVSKKVCRINYQDLCSITIYRMMDQGSFESAKSFANEVLKKNKNRGYVGLAAINFRELIIALRQNTSKLKIQQILRDQASLDRKSCSFGNSGDCQRYEQMKTLTFL
ncbi:hypothetical protein A9Q84_13680 [Halobacteriovorax marinus]|uniref:Uncharacterized protein n=1 Tax=Halobacteriovorax marinus TaxID=97084 RepID=A0A1Y5FEF9_9BACT|nr:hypothetical protein A9Q84_13675 [Halobacteriovorax marinus]OUR97370.1 hypothetical protein A9Q84_13680 [Halobacteriovorax marinus]